MPDRRPRFEKPFTQQEAIPEAVIERAVSVLRSGRLHRYNVVEGETAEAALLERDFAAYQGTEYCLAMASGGTAIQTALRAAGVKPGDLVLANAFTLAPVPGAIAAVGGKPVLVEIDENYVTDTADLAAKARATGARFFLISHMRGHIADMTEIAGLCAELGIALIEDCAHTMGARWDGVRSGNHGLVACFSTQTYKHINSGEGGLLTTDDAEIAARATLLSGSYMFHDRHGAGPGPAAYETLDRTTPNLSARMDNLRATLLRGQLAELEDNIRRWNAFYRALSEGLANCPGLRQPVRDRRESFVGSSFQFSLVGAAAGRAEAFVERCNRRGVDVKWFGAPEPKGFTSRYNDWRYLGETDDLPNTRRILNALCDLRLPLTFDEADIAIIAAILRDEAGDLVNTGR